MTILIKQKLPNGKFRTCSARCYNAKGDTCVCICGHMNHSVGLGKALENIASLTDESVTKEVNVQVTLL